MPKEWILNMTTNRWGLNKKRSVGPVSALIRKCAPKSLREWEEFYLKNVYPKEHLIDLGKKLYVKITEVVQSEIEEVTEEDCINYIVNLVTKRTYEGYITEKQTIYSQLQGILGVKIKAAPDEWDRLYNVDFFIEVNRRFIGLQIKPETFERAPEVETKWKEIQRVTHNKFTKKYGGRVFMVISVKRGRQKVIYNEEVIQEIKEEILRLSST